MTTLKNSLLASIGFAILVGTFVLTKPGTGHTQGGTPSRDVVVVNTASNPVPTSAQGTTNIAGNVNVTNTPSVTLAPGANVGIDPSANSVQFASSPANPVFVQSVDDSVRQVFHKTVLINMAAGEFGNTAFHQVPVGKLLVIEHVSASGIDQGGQHLRFEIDTVANSVQSQHFLVSQRQGNSGTFYTASQQMRVYADGNPAFVSVIFIAGREIATEPASAAMTISGYLVDLP